MTSTTGDAVVDETAVPFVAGRNGRLALVTVVSAGADDASDDDELTAGVTRELRTETLCAAVTGAIVEAVPDDEVVGVAVTDAPPLMTEARGEATVAEITLVAASELLVTFASS